MSSLSKAPSYSGREAAKVAVATNFYNDVFYNMNFPKRGLALIFNHEQFEIPGLENRPESRIDRDALELRLRALEFEVEVLDDKRVEEIQDKISEVAFDVNHSDHDCLLVVIMTHGRCGILTAKDGEYKFDDIWTNFTADKCPSLAGKPKIFITQACQGSKTQKMVTMERAEHDGSILNYTIPTHADFLFAHSTIPDYRAFRREGFGSWYIQSLCKELELNGRTHDFVTLLTFVSRRVAIEFRSYVPQIEALNERKQTPCFVSVLTRLVKFTEKNPR
ncbi:caspase-like [Chrysoperla carnea]|uniref:caspase-like n=1 Tax=Chrysoperla carnea TaxID=189513 RepID=UPI001D0802B4|nr:caspase-like [Chrysoperla carnea]